MSDSPATVIAKKAISELKTKLEARVRKLTPQFRSAANSTDAAAIAQHELGLFVAEVMIISGGAMRSVAHELGKLVGARLTKPRQ